MYRALQYFKFLKQSTNQHGVHSPFVYDLVTKCFYDKSYRQDYESLHDYRKNLLSLKEEISITDLGQGSKVFKTNTRPVKRIVKTSGSTPKRSRLLYRVCNYFKPKECLELGTSLGLATQAMALGNPSSKVTTIEGCRNVSKFTQEQFQKLDIVNIDFKTGHFKSVIPTLNQSNFDLVFFDGHHNKEATLDYFEMLLPKATNDSVFIFDDIYWSKGMTEAWEHIKQHHKLTVTVDTFFWGFVFFRTEQQKQHFKIRM